MANYDIPAICERIEGGETQSSIAQSLGITAGRLSQILSADDNSAKLSARARAASAESWLDKGLAAVESAMDKDGRIDANAARAYAQECARRAALRNPAYRDKVTVSGDSDNPLTVLFSQIGRSALPLASEDEDA
jgi:transcriptional regulator with XRE-family HTH domain